jgi:outer membrane protein OmpA-like peptidoglycan-associated protein
MSNEPNLNPGDSGQDVTDLQQRLHDLGYFDGSVDGQYGDTTEEAVRRFQQDRQLDQTGTVDEHTWAGIGQHEWDRQAAQQQATGDQSAGATGGAAGGNPYLSEDGQWQWDGGQWQPAAGVMLADNNPIGGAQGTNSGATQTQAAQQTTAQPAAQQVSPDGQWWWDGTQWQPTAANQAAGLQLPTGGLHQTANPNVSSTSTDNELTGFATGSAVLTAEHQTILARIAADLNQNPLTFGGYVTLTGYADRRGEAAANQTLGQQRADAVQAYLVQLLTDDETKQQVHAYSLGAPTEGPIADDPQLRKVEVEITRRTYNAHLGPGLTPPGTVTPTPTPQGGLPPNLRLPPDYGQPPDDPNHPNLPDWFWKELPKRPADPPFATQLSRWLNQSLHTHDLARIGGEIAGHLGMDSTKVTHMLDDAFQKGGEAGVKAVIKAVVEGVAGPPAHAPDNPTGPNVNPVPTPQQVQTPQVPTQ